MFKPHFMLLDSVIQPGVTEVICIHSQNNYNCLKAFIKTAPWITILHISENDAVKLLLERKGIGIGCYINLDHMRNNNRARKQRATLMMDVIAKVAKGFHSYMALELMIPDDIYKIAKKPAREVLHTRH